MPAPQLHLTFGELVARHPGVAPEVRRAVEREGVYARLGSVFHDLPYYNNMLAEAVRYGLRRPAIDEPWAFRMHAVRPDRFVASYLRAARGAPGLTTDERLALAAGLLSHCALDLTLHPLVNWIARRDTALHGGHETFHHRLVEKYQALFFHLERLGDDPIGCPDFAARARLVKRGSLTRAEAEPAIIAFMQSAYRGCYGDAPHPRRWAGWVRSFAHFGLLVSSPLAARNSRKVRTDPSLVARYVRCGDFDLDAFYTHSERRLAELIELGMACFDDADEESAIARFCAGARIDNLAEPDGAGLPPLPALPTRFDDRPRRRLPIRLPRRSVERAA